LDAWAQCASPAEMETILAVAQRADPERWRKRLRRAILERDEKTLTRLARQEKVEDLPPASVLLLARALRRWGKPLQSGEVFFTVNPTREAVGTERLALEVLQRSQARHPDDFWINLELGRCLASLIGKTPRQAADTVGFLRVALAIRPRSPELHADLG